MHTHAHAQLFWRLTDITKISVTNTNMMQKENPAVHLFLKFPFQTSTFILWQEAREHIESLSFLKKRKKTSTHTLHLEWAIQNTFR